MFLVGVTLLMDGSLLRRIGRMVEADVGDDLRRTSGIYGVVSKLMFERIDVDHVVLAPTGVFVVEVKWSLAPTPALDHMLSLDAKIAQTRAAARKIAGLLRRPPPMYRCALSSCSVARARHAWPSRSSGRASPS
jgi:hypothetical protein